MQPCKEVLNFVQSQSDFSVFFNLNLDHLDLTSIMDVPFSAAGLRFSALLSVALLQTEPVRAWYVVLFYNAFVSSVYRL